ncbi:hypothetical protein [Marinilactibacillus psychrotolerans]|uniref:hypothetical protein n=1 Tax=Marinilactibacillus psychrotolerans TaxID=191770 RepID=UPI0038894600
MKKINSYEINYANHLLGPKKLVLRGDRSRGDNPILDIYSDDDSNLILKIENGIQVEDMASNPRNGAKERFDIHLGTNILKKLIDDLNTFISSEGLVLDTKNYTLSDPTGTEHVDGLLLGKVKPLTMFPASCNIFYQYANTIAQSDMVYIDAENYPKKKRHHMGGSTKSLSSPVSTNLFEIIISSEFVCRFVKSIELSNLLLNRKE